MINLQQKVAIAIFNASHNGKTLNEMAVEPKRNYEMEAQAAIDTVCEALQSPSFVDSLPLLNHLYGDKQKQYMQLGRSVIAAAIEQIKQA